MNPPRGYLCCHRNNGTSGCMILGCILFWLAIFAVFLHTERGNFSQIFSQPPAPTESVRTAGRLNRPVNPRRPGIVMGEAIPPPAANARPAVGQPGMDINRIIMGPRPANQNGKPGAP